MTHAPTERQVLWQRHKIPVSGSGALRLLQAQGPFLESLLSSRSPTTHTHVWVRDGPQEPQRRLFLRVHTQLTAALPGKSIQPRMGKSLIALPLPAAWWDVGSR